MSHAPENDGWQEDYEPECECVRVDVDRDDARGCPAHGPHSESARRQKQQEADDEFAYWGGMKLPGATA